jgi:tRNA nucleotidyltransferase/poly(A) polymerase
MDLIRSDLGEGQDIFLVGGAIRDILLGQDLHDLDFAMSGDPTSLAKKIARQLDVGFFLLDDDRHTARVVYRREGMGVFPLDFVQFTGGDLLTDLQHRDFTINAIAVSLRNPNKLIDPLGGIKDLAKGLLRTCSDHALIDDPIRILRGVRLSLQFNLHYAPGTSNLMTEASQYLPKSSPERQRDEFFKILEGPRPSEGMAFLSKFGVFDFLIPPLVAQAEVPASPPHTLPLFQHTLKVILFLDNLLACLCCEEDQFAEKPWWLSRFSQVFGKFSQRFTDYINEEITPGRSKKGLLMFGALLHDIGKPETMTVGVDGYLHFYHHAKLGEELAWHSAKSLQLSNAESNWVKTVVAHHMDLLFLINTDDKPSRQQIFRYFKKTGEVGVAIAILSLADTLGTFNQNLTQEKWEQALLVSETMLSAWWNGQDSVIAPTLLLDGRDLQERFGLKPGKKIGTLLERLLEAQASGDVRTEDEAEIFIKTAINKMNQDNGYESTD